MVVVRDIPGGGCVIRVRSGGAFTPRHDGGVRPVRSVITMVAESVRNIFTFFLNETFNPLASAEGFV